jgi:predicted CXXCH cytochrome family protein
MRPWKAVLLTLLLIAIAAIFTLALIIHHGFRASAFPPRWEIRVARAVRNASIPRHESQLKNPVSQDPLALQQGRDTFLTHCSICHGTDGSGRTPVGTNLYPRVPDLRDSATQDLTDGDLHYIIENGVQLTGMPAGVAHHAASSDDSWPLVAFIRTLRPLNSAEHKQQTSTLASAHYIGSAACAKCHSEIYQRWKKTPMANVVRDPREHPDAIAADPTHNPVSQFAPSDVSLVYGALWKQRYFVKQGDDYVPLGVQWNFAQHKWLPYHVAQKGDWWTAFYPDDNRQRPTGPLCDGCHSVDYNIRTHQPVEWNVGCERCHGPGSEHAANPLAENIVNPSRLDAIASTDTCIQCHSQGQPRANPIEGHYYDWPVGFRVDLRLQDFWKLENCTLGETSFYYFPDCTAHKNRMQGNDFAQSLMYSRGITCADCHDVHGNANYAQLRKPANQICLDCHGPSSPSGPHSPTLAAHTHHKDGSTGSQCIACHMPQIQSEGVPGAMVHAHTFRFITPAMTDQYKIPNPCTLCHTDKTTAWAREAMAHWPDASPWNVR